MPDAQLTQEPQSQPRTPRPRWLRVAVEVVVVLAIFAVVGAVAGWVWESLWTPPTGVAYHHHWYPDETGVRGLFSGTGWYVVIGLVAGLLAGVVSGALFRRSEIAVLVAVAAGSLLGGFVMWHVGRALGPPDPQALAARLDDYHKVVGSLTTSGGSYRVAVPIGALLGAGAMFLGLPGRHVPRDQHRPGWVGSGDTHD